LITFLIWFIVSAIQFFYNPLFLNFLITTARTTENRGVVGLAPEPTYLGIVYVFYIIFFLILNFKYKNLLILLAIVGIILFAMSSMAVLFLLIMLLLKIITNLNFKTFLILIIFCLSILLFISYNNESRINYIANMVIENPFELLLLDASINDRFFHVFFCLFISNLTACYGSIAVTEWRMHIRLVT
jgi:hypothetical protein